MLYRQRLASLCAAVLIAAAGTSQAQVEIWKIGGDGRQWSQLDTTDVLIDFDGAPGSIQPLYIQPDQNIISLRSGWSTFRQPNFLGEIGFLDTERPRIWKWDDGRANPTESGILLVDADSSTYSTAIADRIDRQFITIDLSVPVPAHRIGFFTPPVGFRADGSPLAEDFVPAYQVSIQEQTSEVFDQPGPIPLATVVADERENLDPEVRIDFPRQYVRFLRYAPKLTLLDEASQAKTGNVSIALRGTIADFELFGQGVPKRTLYKTGIIDLGPEQNFGRLFFAATPMRMVGGVPVEAPDAQAAVRVEVRTGRDNDPSVYHEFIVTGQEKEVSRAVFEELKPQMIKRCTTCEFVFRTPRPGIRGSVAYDSENWTFWSPPFSESGQPLRLRSGSHIQLQITFESTAFDDFVRLDSLWIERAPLLASRVLGEVARLDQLQPSRGFAEVPLGEMTDFVYDLKPAFDGSGPAGFDGLRIRTGAPPVFKSLSFDGQQIEPAEVLTEADGLLIRLPQRITRSRSPDLRVVFGAEVFDLATSFEAEVLDLERETLPQPVVAGDASDEISTNSLRVLSLSERAQPMRDLTFSTGVLTPNGDGANDELEIRYSLFGLPERVPVALDVFALDGRRIARLVQSAQNSGLQSLRWDGRDQNGDILPPGLYLIQVSIQSEASGGAAVRPLGIAY